MRKSELLRALQNEIQKHSLSTFMDERFAFDEGRLESFAAHEKALGELLGTTTK